MRHRYYRNKIGLFIVSIIHKQCQMSIEILKCPRCKNVNQKVSYKPKDLAVEKRYRWTICPCGYERFHVEQKLLHNPFKKRGALK